MRRQLTRPSEGHASHIFRDKFSTTSSMRRQIVRLLRYSTFGRTCFPYPKRISSRPWDDNLIDYYGIRYLDETRSLPPKEDFSLVHEDDELHDRLGTRTGQVSYLLKGLLCPWDEHFIDYISTWLSDRTKSLSPTKSWSSKRWQIIDCYALDLEEVTKLLIPKRNTSSTRRQVNRLLRYSKKQIKIANNKGNQPIGRQLKRKYYTSKC